MIMARLGAKAVYKINKKLLSKIFGILNLREKRIFIVLIFSQVISMILEVLSIGAIIPLISSLTESNSNTFSNLFKNIQFINFLIIDKYKFL